MLLYHLLSNFSSSTEDFVDSLLRDTELVAYLLEGESFVSESEHFIPSLLGFLYPFLVVAYHIPELAYFCPAMYSFTTLMRIAHTAPMIAL